MTTPQTSLECATEAVLAGAFLDECYSMRYDFKEAAAIIEAYAQQRCASLVALLERAIFNAQSVVSNMAEVQGGYGFSVSDEEDFIVEATAALAQFKGEV